MNSTVGYRRGDLVEVKRLGEILDTLDADGKVRGLLFMPEMARYCGQRFRVYRRATKTCVEGLGMRRMEDAVLLEGLRCDGVAHEGCQRGCLLFWKEAWLNPCTDAAPAGGHSDGSEPRRTEDSQDGRFANLPTKKDDRFCCQSTELSGATRELPGGNLRHFFRDFLAAEITLAELGRILWQKVINRLRRRFGQGLYKHLAGCEVKPPRGNLDLQPGEWVEVKSAEEIASLLDPEGKNWGLPFETEMLNYCGQRFQVAFAIRQVIGEEPGKKNWGKMIRLANTVVLKGVTCRGLCMKNCPRSNYLWWREIWLRRAETPEGYGSAGHRCEQAVLTLENETRSCQEPFVTGVH